MGRSVGVSFAGVSRWPGFVQGSTTPQISCSSFAAAVSERSYYDRAPTKCTGLKQSSIYAAYGDKRGIFLRSLEHYLERILRERIERLSCCVALFADEVDQGAQPSGNMPPSGEIERQAGIGRCPVHQHDLKSSGGDMLRGL